MKAGESKGFSFVIALILASLTACHNGQSPSAVYANGNPDGNLASPNASSQPASSYSETGTAAGSYEQPIEAPEAPPPLPEYSQPPCPGENYIWTPGYWGYSSAGYYWVPGAWVLAPWVGALWTPPWWGYDNGVYVLHAGYWAPHIGFYGGIDYGFGYTGLGYYGAYWNGGRVYYNRAVTNVNVGTVPYAYNNAVRNRRNDRISYNGGRGGIDARPTRQELAVTRDPRTPAVDVQVRHAREASVNQAQFAAGHGARPAALAAAHPLSTPYRAPAEHPPAAAMRAATEAQPAPENRAQVPANAHPARVMTRPGVAESRPGVPENTLAQRPAQKVQARPHLGTPPARGGRPVPETRPFGPETRIAVAPPGAQRPQVRPAVPTGRPMIAQGPASRPRVTTPPAPAARSLAPVVRAMPQPHPTPQALPAPQPRSAPQFRPRPQSAPASTGSAIRSGSAGRSPGSQTS